MTSALFLAIALQWLSLWVAPWTHNLFIRIFIAVPSARIAFLPRPIHVFLVSKCKAISQETFHEFFLPLSLPKSDPSVVSVLGLDHCNSYYKFNYSLNELATLWELVSDVAIKNLSSMLETDTDWWPALPLTTVGPYASDMNSRRFISSFVRWRQ